jgi:hypothetical protein
MTLTELINEVYTITGRADRVNETLSAIKQATLRLHQSGTYYQDIYESGILPDTPAYVQDIDYYQLFPRYRLLSYIQKYDLVNNIPGQEFKIVTPGNVFDDYQIAKQDICYVAGSVIHINSSTIDQAFLWGVYANPDVTVAGYSSWIANQIPYAIINMAAAIVFKGIGKDEEGAAFLALVMDPSSGMINDIKSAGVEAAGF